MEMCVDFITGEPKLEIGPYTSLDEEFLKRASSNRDILISALLIEMVNLRRRVAALEVQ